MASTYVNDLRLNEMATGDASGTWGTVTNTNLELIAEAFSFGTEAITTNADTHTTTIADGSTDPGRSMFLKYTGTLDSACTITIGPNTVSKLWFIENGTSGSQNIIMSQGTGANITIPPGDTKIIYSDGAGSGAAMVDAFAGASSARFNAQKAGLLPPIPGIMYGIELAAGIANARAVAMSANQISSGSAPKFAEGGYVGGRPHSQGGTIIEAERGEFVMSRNATESIGLETLNQMNQQGSGAGINVTVTGNVLTQDFVEGELAESIKEAVRRGSDFGLS